jgi:TetR/AcrR family tetracycline transcriptional repressor
MSTGLRTLATMAATRTKGAARTPLDRVAVVARAMALVDAEGLDALTIRRLAGDVGVTPMAMYWHFDNKESLLDALAESVFAAVELPEPGDDWTEQLRKILDALVRALRPHPAVATLAQTRVLDSRPGLDLAERAMGLLGEAGFDAHEVPELSGYLLCACVAMVAAEPGGAHGQQEDAEQTARVKRAALLSLSPREYPQLVSHADAMATCSDPDLYYRRGVDLLVAGVCGLPR